MALGGLAAIRTAAGFALPKVTTGLTRPHVVSIDVLALATLWSAALLIAGEAATDESGRTTSKSRREASRQGEPRPSERTSSPNTLT